MNYVNTFIAVAPDTSAKLGVVPIERAGKKSIAVLEYELRSRFLNTPRARAFAQGCFITRFFDAAGFPAGFLS